MEPSQGHVQLTLANVRGFNALLKALKIGSKQLCCLELAPEGMSVHWQDDAKTLRSSVQLRRELFESYDCGGNGAVIGINLAQLSDTLGVFASAGEGGGSSSGFGGGGGSSSNMSSSSSAALLLRYPGPDGELQLQLSDTRRSGAGGEAAAGLLLYARLACQEVQRPGDLSEYWSDPVSHFMLTGGLLREAVEDLEWPGGPVSVCLARDPAAISLAASGTGALQVQLPVREMSSFHVAGRQVKAAYKHRNLRAATCHVPDARDTGGEAVSTKVSIDSNGLLKVTHMVPFSSAATTASQAPGSFTGMLPTQAALNSAQACVVQFVSLPTDEEV